MGVTMNIKPIVYLAGNMTPDPKVYNDWTEEIEEKIFSKYRCTTASTKPTEKFIVRQDLARIKQAHIIIVNFGVTDINHHLTGLVVECYEAYKQEMPVYAFTSERLHRSQQANSPWLQHSITHEFKTEEEMILYLMNVENLIVK